MEDLVESQTGRVAFAEKAWDPRNCGYIFNNRESISVL